MFQEGDQIRKLRGDYGAPTEPMKGRRIVIHPKLSPHAESRDSSKNQGTCPRPELSPQAKKRKIQHPWPDSSWQVQLARTVVGQDSSWQAASSLPDHARPQVPWDVSSSWQAASSWQVSLSPEPSWQQSCNSRPACQVPMASAPWLTFSWQGSSHQDPNWHESSWQTLAPSPMSSNWQAANCATADTRSHNSNWQASNSSTADTQNPANARIEAQHNATNFHTQTERALDQLRQRLHQHSHPNEFQTRADKALMHLGTHLRQNSPENVLQTHREKVFLSIRDFLKYDFMIKGKKDPGHEEANQEALEWMSEVSG